MQIDLFHAPASRARVALAALVPLFLAACSGGGGSGPTPPPPAVGALVYGTAATGAAVAGTVSIEDAAGHVKALAVTAGSGAFSASVDGMTAPFMLKVASSDGATVLYSAVEAPGRANITPLTSLALLRIAASRGLQGPADLYAAPSGFAAWDSAANLASASAAMLGRLMPAFVAQLPGASATPQTLPTYDPFGTAWTVGAGVDRLLDAWPVTFSTDTTGVVTASQSDRASGLALDVARSDTAATATTNLAITGAGSGGLVGGSSMQLGARATFQGSAQQGVAATWSVAGPAGVTIDANGKLSAPAIDTAGAAHVSASWYDGTSAFVAVIDITILPAMRPTGIDITGAAANAAVASGASLPLGATVHWSDGSTTTPAATWSWTGDAAAVTQLGSDGLLRAGRPSADSPIHVVATFSQGGVSVSSDLALTVSRFVRRVQSVSLAGLVDGQVLTAGDHADLALTALWNDGSESTLAPAWSSGPAPGAVNHILTTASSAGRLTTASYYVPISADASARAAESDVLQASYDNGDGTSGHLSVNFTVKPLVNIPTALEIRGSSVMHERDTAQFTVWVDYADGSAEGTTVAATSQDAALLAPMATANNFSAAPYASKPQASLVATLAASRVYTYQDANGQPVTTTLSTTHPVRIDWVDPVLVALSVDVDHLGVGTPMPVPVTAIYSKFGTGSTAPATDATFSVDSTLVSIDGNTLTATQAPATIGASWVTLTATSQGSGGSVAVRRLVTIDLPGTVSKHLLAYPWSPLDTDVQFRAISSDGHVDDYTVTRTLPYLLGYDSPATRRRMRLLSGVSDFAQARTAFGLMSGASQETQYVAAVERGQVVVLRHDDLYNATNLVPPVVLTDVTNARQVALVVRRDDGLQPPAAVRLYVLDQGGTVRQYKLPYWVNRPLVASDVSLERQLSGTYTQISAGSDFIQLLSTSGVAYAEGASESGALGDPTGSAHWSDTFAVQYGVNCNTNCVYSTLTGVTLVHAGVGRSFAALTDDFVNWGIIGPGLTLEYFDPARPVYPPIDIAGIVDYAWLQGDGSVHYENLMFAEDDIGGPGNIRVGSTRFNAAATWLSPAVEIVDGRRTVAAIHWPEWSGEVDITPTMSIIRTRTDTLFYLDGRPILDPHGNAIVLP
ncbi:MAG: hypothetical protein ACJ8IK_29545 [Burkholderiaceae bacterium]